MAKCTSCKYEEFFLASWAVGDPAMVVDKVAFNTTDCVWNTNLLTYQCKVTPNNTATVAKYPDDPSNVYHSYMLDHTKFQILHAGVDLHHMHHQHAHQWMHTTDTPNGDYTDSQTFGPGSSFRRILVETDPLVEGPQVRRVLLCSGKVYFDLVAERRKRNIDDIAILRIEQLYPFPISRLGQRLSQYPNADVVWCQEEPENMGAWHFVDRRIDRALGTIDVPDATTASIALLPAALYPLMGTVSIAVAAAIVVLFFAGMSLSLGLGPYANVKVALATK